MAESINENIPMFPLGIIVLPGETKFLHIFEQRYKNLFEDITKTNYRFGIPFISKGRMDGIGSLVRLEKTLACYPGGEVDIAIRGIDLFNVKSYVTEHSQRLYPTGNVEMLDKNSIRASSQLINVFDKYNKEVLKLDLKKFPNMNFYVIANSVGLNDLEKYDLLMRESDEAINKSLINHIRLKTLLAQQHRSLQEYYCLN